MSLLWDLKYHHFIINTSIKIIYQHLYIMYSIDYMRYVILYQNMYIFIALYGHEHLNKNQYRDIYSPTTY